MTKKDIEKLYKDKVSFAMKLLMNIYGIIGLTALIIFLLFQFLKLFSA